MQKRALITGITGQDGSYLAEFLLDKGYRVYGLVRRSSLERFDRIEHCLDRIQLIQGDVSDQSSLDEGIRQVLPDEVYHFAAQSFVPTSWNQPVLTADVTGSGVTRMLESIRKHKQDAKFYQASSSEMFGKVQAFPQNEQTPFYPLSPYAVSKVYGHAITASYRESYGLFACAGIAFNHESPRRGLEFVTRKISYEVAKIKMGLSKQLRLGNLSVRRDWGFAKEYVEAMWLMLQQDQPGDYVIATGVMHSVRDVVNTAFSVVDLNPEDYLVVDASLFRPAEVDLLVGDASKAKRELGWQSRTSFETLIEMMVKADLDRLTSKSRASQSVIADDRHDALVF